MTDDADERFFHDTLLSVYRDIAPEATVNGEYLIRRLSGALYARGARLEIGNPAPPRLITVHQSINAEHRIVWTGKEWNQVLGYRSHAVVGRHIAEFYSGATYQHYREQVWPELLREGKVGPVTVTMVTYHGEHLPGEARCEILRDEAGNFSRTFTKIRLRVPLLHPMSMTG